MPKQVAILRNVLILAALVSLVGLGWLVGHILRYSTPALWHPPIQENNPHIERGTEFEFEGIRRFAALPEMAPRALPLQALPNEVWDAPSLECSGPIYFTTLPAKCRTADGRLVQAREFESNIILIPQRK